VKVEEILDEVKHPDVTQRASSTQSAQGHQVEAARPSVHKPSHVECMFRHFANLSIQIGGVLLMHKMEPERLTKLCNKCHAVLSPAFECVTCAMHAPQCTIIVCTQCIRHLWPDANHIGHIWKVVYQPTNAGVVVASLTPWLQAGLQSHVPTHEEIDTGLVQQLEVHLDIFLLQSGND
jgi:hypothetical protein